MTILLLETIDDEAMAVLKSAGPVIVSPSPDTRTQDLPFADVTAIITRGLGRLDRDLMDKCPTLKVIARCGAGLNNLDLDAAAEKNIQVIFAPGLSATAVAEHTLMLMLMAIRQGFDSAQDVKNAAWSRRDDFSGDDLSGKKILVVGSGNIGRKTADLCRAFAMDVTVCGRGGKGIAGLKRALHHHLPNSDVVSLHIPLTEETRNLIAGTELQLIKVNAVLVNTARGELVNTDALVSALNDGHLNAYAADVVAGESPKQDNPITKHPRCIVTPHVATLTARTYREMGLFTARNVVLALQNAKPDPVSVYRGAA